MRHPSQWFSTVPENEGDDVTRRWYQRTKEWGGEPESRGRLMVGDISAPMEREGGEPAGAVFIFDLRFWENTGQFDYDDSDRWHDHSFTVTVWRWGFYLAWRGGRKAGR